jgi:RNA recognition motif-containing protein
MPVRLYVGNLPKEEVDRQELQAIFAEAGDTISTKVIKDRKTGQCRGFAFVTVKTDEQADQIIEKFNGYLFKDSPLKIEKALPRTKTEGEEDEPNNKPAAEAVPAPVSAPRSGNAPSGGGGGSRRNKKNRKAASTTGGTTVSTDSDSVQPDPRWAAELAKLKELLATQTSNS